MLSKCCCCIPLRTGSLILAVLGILGGFAKFASSAGQWNNIIEGVFFILSYGSLLFGALKYNAKAVLVCLVCTGVLMLLEIVFGIIAFVKPEIFRPELANNCATLDKSILWTFGWTCNEYKWSFLILAAGKSFGSLLVNVYFWICNYSFYKELKKEGGGSSA